jgi:hypothetical protein
MTAQVSDTAGSNSNVARFTDVNLRLASREFQRHSRLSRYDLDIGGATVNTASQEEQ